MKKSSRDYSEIRNIRILPSGYQVCVTREGREFSKHFAGHSTESLRNAEKYRDMLLRMLPSRRRHDIPRRILTALGLKQPVVGVTRYPKGCYAVSWRDKNNRTKTRTFSWDDARGEVNAYKAAMAFRRTTLKARRKA
ncbi:MAG: hypothetical protein JO354_06925 [Verrucomicrobia bacterium]|nr:hypothetical protein [Verrucomicrobiota bacterium]